MYRVGKTTWWYVHIQSTKKQSLTKENSYVDIEIQKNKSHLQFSNSQNHKEELKIINI